MNFDLSNMEDMRSLSFQILLVLFVAVVVYLYINFKSNRKKIGKRRLTLSKPVQEKDRPQRFFDGHDQFFNAIPIPLCRINVKGEIEVFNKAFSQLVLLSAANIKFREIGDLFEEQVSVIFRQFYKQAKNELGSKSEKVVVINDVAYKIYANHFDESDDDTENILISFEPYTENSPITNSEFSSSTVIEEIIKDASISILLLNGDGKILLDNQAVRTLHGSGDISIKGKNVREILPVEFQDSIKSNYDVLFTREKLVFKGVLSNCTGKIIPVSVSVVPVKINNNVLSLLFIDDISLLVASENKLIEAQKKVKQFDLLKTSFLANMSHEIRTPLNAILGFSELLSDPSFGKVDRFSFVKQIKQSGESLLDLMTGIINFSRISSGAVSIKKEKVDLNDVFIRLQNFSVKTNKSKSIPVDIRINMPIGGVDYFLYSDEEKVFQFLKNLIDNAIKFTYSGSVEFGCRERGTNYLEFFVKDTGIGIPKENRKLIFERFVQGDDSSNREFGGTGIGLTISAVLVRLLGGYLWIESAVDIGSCFNVVLPKDLSQLGHKDTTLYFNGGCLEKSILVIDEMEDSYTDLLQVSTSKQYLCFWAQNIREAKNMVLSNQIDLILVNGNCYSEGEELTQFISDISKITPVLSFNNRVLGIDKSMYLESYPFTEKEIMMLYKKYLQSSESETNSNSISI